jgi:hypothetical protein
MTVWGFLPSLVPFVPVISDKMWKVKDYRRQLLCARRATQNNRAMVLLIFIYLLLLFEMNWIVIDIVYIFFMAIITYVNVLYALSRAAHNLDISTWEGLSRSQGIKLIILSRIHLVIWIWYINIVWIVILFPFNLALRTVQINVQINVVVLIVCEVFQTFKFGLIKLV